MKGKSKKTKTPRGWCMAGSKPEHYESFVDESTAHSGTRSACMKNAIAKPDGYATLMQMFSADQYFGKRLRMTIWVKTAEAKWAAPWLRIDGQSRGQSLSFDNFCERSIVGTTDWTKYESVVDVPPSSSNIAFGVMLGGTGKLWIDHVAFDTVSEDVPVTDCPCSRRSRSQPVNLNFEDD